MKELSIEDKARRYDEALRKARIYYDDYKTRDNILYVEDMEDMFPELKESEDERIRKAIIDFLWKEKIFLQEVHSSVENNPKYRFVMDAIAWLEKQGEYKSPEEVLKIRQELYQSGYNDGYKHGCEDSKKQGDQEEHQVYKTEDGDTITYSETDGYKVVEQKFHEGQWVVGANNIYKIISLNDEKNCYIAVTPNNEEVKIPYYFDDGKGHMCSYHLWNIQDAKDGDVLACHGCIVIFKEIDGLNIKCHCAFHYLGFNPNICIDTLQNKTAFRPATKEERDVLFEKMKEDCCEWSNEQRKRINELRKRIKI